MYLLHIYIYIYIYIYYRIWHWITYKNWYAIKSCHKPSQQFPMVFQMVFWITFYKTFLFVPVSNVDVFWIHFLWWDYLMSILDRFVYGKAEVERNINSGRRATCWPGISYSLLDRRQKYVVSVLVDYVNDIASNKTFLKICFCQRKPDYVRLIGPAYQLKVDLDSTVNKFSLYAWIIYPFLFVYFSFIFYGFFFLFFSSGKWFPMNMVLTPLVPTTAITIYSLNVSMYTLQKQQVWHFILFYFSFVLVNLSPRLTHYIILNNFDNYTITHTHTHGIELLGN